MPQLWNERGDRGDRQVDRDRLRMLVAVEAEVTLRHRIPSALQNPRERPLGPRHDIVARPKSTHRRPWLDGGRGHYAP